MSNFQGRLQRFTTYMLGQAGGRTRKAVVSRQLVPRATGAARQGVAHNEGHFTGTPTAGLVEVTAANEPRRWGTLVPALMQKNDAGMVLRHSSSRGNPEGRMA
ncbi:hypothetical protein TcCL_ESM07328 [Trypanosoma cruzi]|nr:hypothetical protein TcCL_ESM07328 [Trypanosoma cruzi]